MKKEKFKLKKDSLTYLKIHYPGNISHPYYSIDVDRTTGWNLNKDRGIEKLEKRVLLVKSGWLYAYLVDNKTGKILHYYHSKTGTKRLSKIEYNKILGYSYENYNLYLVPGHKMRLEGNHKGEKVFNVKIDDVSNYWRDELSKIIGYKNNKQKFTFKNGKFSY